MPKKRNPQDTTLRNVRAANRRIAQLTEALRRLSVRVRRLEEKPWRTA